MKLCLLGRIGQSLDVDSEEYETAEGESVVVGVVAKLYAVFPKVLQELQIRYEPELASSLTGPLNSVASMSMDEAGKPDKRDNDERILIYDFKLVAVVGKLYSMLLCVLKLTRICFA